MFIESINLHNFRNYEDLHLDLSDGTHIFYGENAQGKTNLLEAVYLAAANKSHRSAKDREMIRFGEDEAHIKVMAVRKDVHIRIDMHLKKDKNKGIAVNGVPLKRSRDFIGTLNAVIFSPEDLQIVKEGPQERRKFIDTELCQLDPIYTSSFINYRKALEERNKLLKDLYYEPSLRDTMDVWDEQLVRFGKDLIRKRKDFVKELGELILPVHDHLSGGREELRLRYEPDADEDDFSEKLRASRDRDSRMKTTTVGPHRDDFGFILNDTDARIYGSQGQQRTSALSLKMAEISMVRKKTGNQPILLLDDVFSELDSARQSYLLESIQDIQTFITCTGLDDFVSHYFEKRMVYEVKNGSVIRKE